MFDPAGKPFKWFASLQKHDIGDCQLEAHAGAARLLSSESGELEACLRAIVIGLHSIAYAWDWKAWFVIAQILLENFAGVDKTRYLCLKIHLADLPSWMVYALFG